MTMSKDRIEKLKYQLGNACNNCGYDRHHAPLAIVDAKTTQARKQHQAYAAWIMEVMDSVVAKDGRFILWCRNCLVEKNWGDAESAAAPVYREVILWNALRDEMEMSRVLEFKMRWMADQMRDYTLEEAFVLAPDGRVYPYEPEKTWRLRQPVADTWEEFAKARRLDTKLPPEGTTMVYPK